MERLQTGYYTIEALSNALDIKGDIFVSSDGKKLSKVISKEEQAIDELHAWGYQFFYFKDNIGTFPPTPHFKDRSRSFVIIVTVPKNTKYNKDRKYSYRHPIEFCDAALNFTKEPVIQYETKTKKYNCRKIHSVGVVAHTRQGGTFAKDFYAAAPNFKDDFALALAENKVTLEESKSREDKVKSISEACDFTTEKYKNLLGGK